MTSTGFCPKCGNQRVGQFRYCRSCGFDFDQSTAEAPTSGASDPGLRVVPPPAVQPAARGMGTGRIVAWGIIGVLIVAIGLLIVQPGMLNSVAILGPDGGTPIDTPPAGAIWFGETFDTTTFELSGRTSSVGANDSFAAVAQLTKITPGDAINLRLSYDGSVVSNTGVNWNGSGDVWGWTSAPLVAAGAWTIALTDIGGNVLASGTLTVTEE